MNWDEEESKEPVSTPDTENSTRMNPSEGELSDLDKTAYVGGRSKWDRLSTLNTGAADSLGQRESSVARKQERAAAFDVVSDQLHLPDYIQREGRNLMMDEVSMDGTNQTVSVHLLAFCLAACLVNEHHSQRDYHPERNRENNDELFVIASEVLEFDSTEINRHIQRVEENV